MVMLTKQGFASAAYLYWKGQSRLVVLQCSFYGGLTGQVHMSRGMNPAPGVFVHKCIS